MRWPDGHRGPVEIADLHSRTDLLAIGFTDSEVQRRRRTGLVVPVRRGLYLLAGDPRLIDPVVRHALLVRAAMPRLALGSVASQVSAAALHGLPIWAIPLGRVHVIRGASGGRVSSGLHVHTGRLDLAEVVEVGGLAVTSPARTLVDLARTVPFEQAVVVADAALARGLVDPVTLAAAAHAVGRRRGGPAARRVAAFADGRSESVGESRSRVAIARAGLPTPVPQWEVHSADGRLVGRVDFGWPAQRAVGEFDGRIKYGRLLRPGQQPGDAVFVEKRREDELRAEDLAMVRWTWVDLDHFDPVAARLRRRLDP